MNIFKKLKSGMTLAELMIVFVIISVLAYFAIVTIKPYNRTLRYLYSKAFHSLEVGLYNALITDVPDFPDTPKKLCEALLTYVNASEASCSNVTVDTDARNFPDEAIQFIASNSMRFYISEQKTYLKTINVGSTFQEEITFPYFIVFVDLTGDKKPNSAEWRTKGGQTDIVAFAISEVGVAALGPPIFDINYIPTKIEYPPTPEKPIENYSEKMTYYEAKSRAWGGFEDMSNMHTLNFNDEFSENSLIKITYPIPPTLDTANGCSNDSLDCIIIVDTYN